MEQFNYDLLKEVVNTQYNDMKGIAAIDGHEAEYLWKMCEDQGVDFNEWFLVGLGFSDGETIGRYPLYVCAYLVKKSSKNEEYNEMANRLDNMKEVDIYKKYFHISYEDLGKYIKRLRLGVMTTMSGHIQSAKFIEEE